MDFQQEPNQPAARPARQFSIRNLLQLTLIVSILLTIGVLASGTEHFRAFSTAWTAVSLLPMAAVLVAYRWELVSHRKLVIASVLGYIAALCLPSIGGGNEIEFGFQAAFMSFVGLQYLWDPIVHANIAYGSATTPVPFLTITIEPSLVAACVLAHRRTLLTPSALPVTGLRERDNGLSPGLDAPQLSRHAWQFPRSLSCARIRIQTLSIQDAGFGLPVFSRWRWERGDASGDRIDLAIP